MEFINIGPVFIRDGQEWHRGGVSYCKSLNKVARVDRARANSRVLSNYCRDRCIFYVIYIARC